MVCKSFIHFSFFFLLAIVGYAHPGIGIVSDSQGNIFYTDLNHVWKITPEGDNSIYVPKVHTHELFINKEDELMGENAWYEGEVIDKWGFSVWKKRVGKDLEFMIDTTVGFLFEHPFSFVRDGEGSMYWREKNEDEYLFKTQTKEKEIKLLATGKFENIRWMYWLNGHLHFVDMDDLYRLIDGKFELLANDLRSSALPFSTFVRDMHSIMGAWDDKEGNIYVSVFSGKMVKKITPDGEVTEFFKSKGNWSPSGGLFDREGNLWLLEYSSNNEARVRKFTANEIKNAPVKMGVKSPIKFWDPFVALGVLVVGLALIKIINNLKT